MAFKVKDLMISVLPGQGHGAGGPQPACKLPVSLPCFAAGGGTVVCDDISCGGCSLPHHNLTNGCHGCSHCTACSVCSACSAHTCHLACSHVASICQVCSLAGCTNNHSIICQQCSFITCGICSHGGCTNNGTIICQICSHGGCSHLSCVGGCSVVQISVCGAISPCGGSITGPGCGGSGDPGPIEQVDNLAALKAQLQQALAHVEAQEKAVEASMKPQTVEEVDDLTKKLTEALTELKSRKEEILKEDAAKKAPEKKP